MTLHADVVAALDERASQRAADELVAKFEQAGKTAGKEFRDGLQQTMSGPQLSGFVDEFAKSLDPQFRQHGTRAARGFGDAFGSELDRSIPGVSGFSQTMSGYESAAGKAGAAAGRALGIAFTAAAGGLLAGGAYTLFKGFERYEALDGAKHRLDAINTSMEAMGKTGVDVTATMNTVQQVVQGTPFALDQAFSVAVQGISSGVTDIKRFMTDIADAAGFAGGNIQDIGQVFTQIVNQGKVDAGMLDNQLQNLPIRAWLQDTYGASLDVQSAIKNGQIGIEQLMYTIEQHAGGMSHALGDTVQGSIENLQTSIARLGANFLSALFGKPTDDAHSLTDAIKAVSAGIDDVGKWVTDHKDDIHEFFETGVAAIGELINALSSVAGFLLEHKGLVETVVAVWGTFKLLKLADTLAGVAGGIGTMGTAAGAAATGGLASMLGKFKEMAPFLGPAGLLTAVGIAATDPDAYTADIDTEGFKRRVAAARGGDGSGKGALGAIGSMFPNIPGMNLSAPGGPGGPPPPLQPGSGKGGGPEVPYDTSLPDWAANLPQTAQIYGEESSWLDARHTLAQKRADLAALEKSNTATEDELVKARNAVAEADRRQNESELRLKDTIHKDESRKPVVAYDTSLPPQLGGLTQTPEVYNAEVSWLDARNKAAQKQAELNQLEGDSTAKAEDVTKARNEVVKSQIDMNQAEMRIAEAVNQSSKKTADAFKGLGAAVDADFGISGGLPGIADNLVRFFASLAAAPALGKLAVQGQGATGSGLIGISAAQGAFGPQYVQQPAVMAPSLPGSGSPSSAPSSAGGYAGDAALLANVPAGRYTQEQRGDLTKGLADCSSAVEDLVNLMDGRPTAGASMATGNEAQWLTAHGFLPGVGGPGDFRVGFNSGHTQATLPGGTPFNWGSDAAAQRRGIGGTGADDPAFTSHFYRPTATGAGSPSAIGPTPLGGEVGAPLPAPPGQPSVPGGPPMSYGGAGISPTTPGVSIDGQGQAPLQLGGVEPYSNPSGGQLGITPGGSIDTALGVGAAMLPGIGQAAQTGVKEANRAIQFAGQAVGIGIGGAIDTLVPFGGSELANKNWLTRIVGGLAGARPALPNTAGKSPNIQAVQPGQQQQGQQGNTTTINATVNNHGATEDQNAKTMAHHLGVMYAPPGT